jgi:hypothetical protein
MLPGRTIYSGDQPGITNFKLNTINRTSGHVEKPLNMPSVVVTTDSTTLTRGQTYTVTITHSEDAVIFPGARNNIRVWIDYNKNSSWEDAGETVVTADLKPSGVFTATFTVPSNAPLGTTWLRATAKMSADAGHTLPTSCDVPADPLDYHGEMEDYKVKIVAPTSISETSGDPLAAVFPNPVCNSITVSLKENNHQSLRMELFDITGKMACRLLDDEEQSAVNYSFKLNDYAIPAGIYFLKVSSGTQVTHQKIIKTN